MFVIAVPICFGGYAAGHIHQTFHTCIVMTRLQASKVNLAGFGELPNDLATFTGCDSDHIGIGMFHFRVFLHHFIVVIEVFGCTKHHLVLHFA